MKKQTFLIVLLFLSISAWAQKKPLSVDDFASWNRIKNAQISHDGNWVSYEINQQKGDGKLVVYSVTGETSDTLEFGYDAKFLPGNKFLVFKQKPAAQVTRKAKLAKTKKDKMPKDTLVYYNLANGEINKLSTFDSYQISKENSQWIAYLTAHVAAKDTTVTDTVTDKDKAKKKPKKDKKSKDLIVVNPETGDTHTFNKVTKYALAQKDAGVMFVTFTDDSTKLTTLESFNLNTQQQLTHRSDTGKIEKLSISNSGNYGAYLHSFDTTENKTFKLFQVNLVENLDQNIAQVNTLGMPKGFSPSINGKIFYSDDESKLYFGTAKIPVNEEQDSILDEEIPKLDLWSWTDLELQPMQLKRLAKEKKRTFQAVYTLKDKKVFQIGDSVIRDIRLVNKNNGEFALGSTDRPYVRATSWNAEWVKDYYLIDLKKGTKKKVITSETNAKLSPSGRYIVFYSIADSNYHVYDNKKGSTKNLTKNISVALYNELNDSPTHPRQYGTMGWSADEKYIFIYDRYDIWKLDLSAKTNPVNVTNGKGRKTKTKFRYIKLDKEAVYLPQQEILCHSFNEENFNEGYYTVNLTVSHAPLTKIEDAYRFSYPKKAKDVDTYVWTKQDVKHYPELRVSTRDFIKNKVISSTNPQQDNFNWATVETLEWKSFANDTLKGLLYKPEDFDPNKKYPVVIYFYERSSNNIHRHYTPYPSHSIINKTFYASNGYLVFVPDIVYRIGYPGKSAYDAIVSGAQHISNKFDYVDADRMALQGQSWGGYQIAWLVTQTDMFAAAMAGAPVSNMTSAYGGIRWGTGMSRMFQYEHTQSRIGGTLWEKPMHYVENSPIFYTPNVNTPLLIMHNDEDGAVPWYQGIEYFVSLRRLNKPAWMLTYNGVGHNIQSKYWANRMDLSKRMLQFFNHYLKDEPQPEWMIKGIPAIEKGKNLGY